ncbi:hypothetical protein [Kitasatospora sp. NPDC059462]|uniref:hypothetical protein n=1 Tax=Kitasatospora sp. NPDC059462 TaxID=3346841 RepID=UPI0036CADBBC
MSGEHLITDGETKLIAEGFLAACPWFGDVQWGRVVIGAGSEYLGGWTGDIPDDQELTDDQRWSWTVSFSDPAGNQAGLSHEGVLKGLSRVVYDDNSNSNSYRNLVIGQWFREPTETRLGLKLSTSDQSLICQQALYGKSVFPTGGAEELFGKKLDVFESQRPDAADED